MAGHRQSVGTSAAVCSDSLHSSAAALALWCERNEVNDPELQRQLTECTQRPAFVPSTKARHWRSARGGPQVTRCFAPFLLLFLLLGSGCFLATGQSTVTAAEARKHHNPGRKFKPTLRAMQGRFQRIFSLELKSVAATSSCGALRILPVVAKYRNDACVIWFDAHADLNTPESSTTGFLGSLALSGPVGLWGSGLGIGIGVGKRGARCLASRSSVDVSICAIRARPRQFHTTDPNTGSCSRTNCQRSVRRTFEILCEQKLDQLREDRLADVHGPLSQAFRTSPKPSFSVRLNSNRSRHQGRLRLSESGD